MRRFTPLRANAAATRAWQDRSRVAAIDRARAAATTLGDGAPESPPAAAGPGLQRGRRKRKARIHKSMRQVVFARSGGLCIVCVYDLVRAGRLLSAAFRAVQVHHVFPEFEYPHLARDPDNLVGVCPGCHDNHERAHRRIPRATLPQCSIELGEREGLRWYIEKTYPA